MQRTHLPPRFETLLQTVPYVCMATVCPDGRPWNTPVVVRFDDELTMYWVSNKESQHSKNLLLTPSLFVILFDTSVPEGEGSGLYMQLEAKELHTSADIQCAQGIYDTSFFVHPPDHEPFRGVCPQRIYQAAVQRLWCNTSYERHGHYIDARRSLP